jgi:nucleotide-binding universal stress UspA family protein
LELAKLAEGEITALSIIYTALKFPKSKEEVEKEQRQNAKITFYEIGKSCNKIGITVNLEITDGSPWTMIVEEARKGHDIIVMGSKGESALGSVAEKVVRDAQCPVLVCKTPK